MTPGMGVVSGLCRGAASGLRVSTPAEKNLVPTVAPVKCTEQVAVHEEVEGAGMGAEVGAQAQAQVHAVDEPIEHGDDVVVARVAVILGI